ncbi:short-chain dehydrogenase/reductase SDR [Spirochaeta thermophila DSM 6578]|uniref:Short-chain dehydrogenase/reductase SDR n=1 Tax=Winmispira thermophila (strain ATCC 700085 / DSM 6578 / Z-1203) TaxID=869211 RepID=G0GFR5_WINT7|nr:SDR family NAD(P)-dependent oxidoreductase [Spirochaeta thermophila]AEJ61608.1 short-chain dehydrogenase/reductase SDR [Spirochaeta thermophila DSM 6578]
MSLSESMRRVLPYIRGMLIGSTGRPVRLVPVVDPPGVPFEIDLSEMGEITEERVLHLLSTVAEEWRDERSGSRFLLVRLREEERCFRVEGRGGGPGRGEPGSPYEGLSTKGREDVVRGRVAVVTGGAQGFGEQIVRGLCASGAYVCIADLNAEGAERLADEINAEAGEPVAWAVQVNVADEGSVEGLFARIVEEAGGLDLCVSNAGVLRAGSVLSQSSEDFRFVTEVNYVAFFLVTKHAARIMRAQHLLAPRWYTDIVQINSKSGLAGSNKNGAYAGSKFGGIGLVQSFALELVEYHIKVNAICPGNFFDGPLWSDPEKGLFVQYLRAGKVPGARTVDDVRRYYESKIPMGRGCTGPDVMRALYYIVEQEYETGQALPVAGGQVMLH